MVSPINYMLNVRSPFEQAMRGFEFGQGARIREAQEARTAEEFPLLMQQRQQALDIQRAQESRAAAEFEQRRQAADAAQARAQAMQEQLMGLRTMALEGTLTPEALDQFALANASTFEEFRSAYDQMSEPRRRADAQFGIQLATSLLSGNQDVALSMIDERIAAAENAGDAQEVASLRANRTLIEMDPQAQGVATLALLTSSGAIDSATMKAVLDAAGQTGPVEGASPIGKIAQDVEAGLIPRSVLDAQIRVEEKAGQEGLTLQQRIAEEARLRGEYAKRTEDLSAAERNFSVIQTSAQDNSGAGDIALVTSFMKMLDPGSVVRETEFATAANAGGLLARLGTIASRIEDGQFLTPSQRADFQRLAGQYLEAAKEQEGRVQQSYRLLVDNYGLDPINVFGARAVTAAPSPAAPAPAPAPAPSPAAPAAGAIPQGFLRSQSVIDAAARAGVTPEEMWAVMSPEQRARYGE